MEDEGQVGQDGERTMMETNLAYSVIVNGVMWLQDRWDVREILEGIAYFWNDAYDIEMLNERLALLIPSPTYSMN